MKRIEYYALDILFFNIIDWDDFNIFVFQDYAKAKFPKLEFSYFHRKEMMPPSPYDFDEDDYIQAGITNNDPDEWTDEEEEKFYNYFMSELDDWKGDMKKKGFHTEKCASDYDGTLMVAGSKDEVSVALEIQLKLPEIFDVKDPYI